MKRQTHLHYPRIATALGALLAASSASADEIDGIDSRAAVAGAALESTSRFSFMNLETSVVRTCPGLDVAVPMVNIYASDGSSVTCTQSLGAPVLGQGTCSVPGRPLPFPPVFGPPLVYPIYSQQVSRPAFAGGWAFVTINVGTEAAPAYRIYASQHSGGGTCAGWGPWTPIAAPAIPAGDGLSAPSAIAVGTTTYVLVADNGANGYGGIYYANDASGDWPTASSGWSTTPSVREGLLGGTVTGVPVVAYSGGQMSILELAPGSNRFVYFESASINPDTSLAFEPPDPNYIWRLLPFNPQLDPSGVNQPAKEILSACALRDFHPPSGSPGLQVVCQDLNGRYYAQSLATLLGPSPTSSTWTVLGGPMPNTPPSPVFNPLAPTSALTGGLFPQAVLLANSTSDATSTFGLYVAQEEPTLFPPRGLTWTSFGAPVNF